MDKHLLNKILSNFEITGNLTSFKKISSGYINDTFKIFTDGYPRYILQYFSYDYFKDFKKNSKVIMKRIELLVLEPYIYILKL